MALAAASKSAKVFGLIGATCEMTARVTGSTFSTAPQHGQPTSKNSDADFAITKLYAIQPGESSGSVFALFRPNSGQFPANASAGQADFARLLIGRRMVSNAAFTDVPTAVEEIRAGRMIVVVDDEDRENEGDLTLAAEKITPEAINFMAKYGRGLICLAMTPERLDYLRIGPMTRENTSPYGTAFYESVEAREGVTTGISAHDRARTIQVAIDPTSRAADLVRPGHVFPLCARKGGVLVRAGQTEASVDLARLAGMIPAGVICEIMNEDGTMARVPDLMEFCKTHGLKMLTVAELIRYRMQNESYVVRVGEAMLPTRHGEFRMIAFESQLDGESHVALVKGDVERATGPVLVRMHAHCLAGDVFGGSLCDCQEVLDRSLEMIAREGTGALIYLHQTSKGFNVDDEKRLAF